MNGLDAHAVADLIAVVAVTAATLAIGTWAFRFSRTTSDFMVASRSVNPRLNASAVSGEYLSAASFLGAAGLLLTFGADMFWYPIGWTAGMLVLLVAVAAPLRRSGAYTLPDFAEARLDSRVTRLLCSLAAVLIGWLYLAPQFRGAGLTMAAAVGTPTWVGGAVVAAVVLVNVTAGGMRSITFVQAFQYWLKLTALLVPAVILVMVWINDGSPSLATPAAGTATAEPLLWASAIGQPGWQGTYGIYSLIVATFLGTMGLPHVVVRFYTNPDGSAARRTTLVVLALLGVFYLLPPVYGALGRYYAADVDWQAADSLVLELPRLMIDGPVGIGLSALVTAGAFAAFLSTSSGVATAVSGVLGQELSRLPGRQVLSGIRAFRAGALLAVLVPGLLVWASPEAGVAQMVGLVFAVAASTFCPLLVLGIWWRGLTPPGAVAGLLVGGLTSAGAAIWTLLVPSNEVPTWGEVLLAQPAAWTAPLAFAVMIGVSLATKGRIPAHATRFMVRLHTPEAIDLKR